MAWIRNPRSWPFFSLSGSRGQIVRFADPGSGTGKKWGSGMNNPDHISESLSTIFRIKILKFFDADPGSGMEKIRIRDKQPGSAKHWIKLWLLCFRWRMRTLRRRGPRSSCTEQRRTCSSTTGIKLLLLWIRWRMRTLRRRGPRSSCTEQRRTCPSTTGGTSQRRKAQK